MYRLNAVSQRTDVIRIRQQLTWTYTDDTILLVKYLYVQFIVLTRNDGVVDLSNWYAAC